MKQTRREFLHGAAVASAALAIGPPHPHSRAVDSEIELILTEPIGTIAPEIYGHFVEHLGGVVYDGIWVGEGSRIPNAGGIRRQLVEAFRKIRPSVIRWPGGCFADQYDWHDGVGPRAARPKRTNFWVDASEWPAGARRNGPQSYDSNQFGTLEFSRFCRQVGAQPYLAANLRSLRPQDFWRWIEYCNSPANSTTLAAQRTTEGEREPLGIRFWGVGNESWGCGGNFLPEDYAMEFRRFTAWTPGYGKDLSFIGSGPNGGDLEWTRRFFARAAERGALWAMWGWGLHHYAWNTRGGRGDWGKDKSDAVRFSPSQYYELLADANRVESLIKAHWQVMAESDPKHAIKLVVDEWGAWHAPGSEPFSEALFGQQSTMRDAVLAGLTLDTFNRHADKVAMANVAQLINCLQSLFLAHEEKFCVTPTYHVFDLYSSHMGAQSIRTEFLGPSISFAHDDQRGSLPGLAGSASLKEKALTLTVTNPSLDTPREARITVRGGRVQTASATALWAREVTAHNRFEEPRAVEPRRAETTVREGTVVHLFPPASVTKFAMALV